MKRIATDFTNYHRWFDKNLYIIRTDFLDLTSWFYFIWHKKQTS